MIQIINIIFLIKRIVCISLIIYLLNYLFKMQLYESEESNLQFILKIDFRVSTNIGKYIVLIDDRIFSKKMNESKGYLFSFSSIFESFHGFQ